MRQLSLQVRLPIPTNTLKINMSSNLVILLVLLAGALWWWWKNRTQSTPPPQTTSTPPPKPQAPPPEPTSTTPPGALNAPAGASIRCTNADPEYGGQATVHRWMHGQLRPYPSPDVARSWNTVWNQNIRDVDCQGLQVGPILEAAPDVGCDWFTYAVRHQDLMDRIGSQNFPGSYRDHYFNQGHTEGRDCRPDQEVWHCFAYLNRYPDLKQAFDNDCEAAFRHYIHYGRHEGRNCAISGDYNPNNPITNDAHIIGSGPTTPQPGPKQDVVVFERATYGGRSHVLPIGSYPSLPGWTNDSISSVKVPPGRILHLYAHPAYKGPHFAFFADWPGLPEVLNDKASSARVE